MRLFILNDDFLDDTRDFAALLDNLLETLEGSQHVGSQIGPGMATVGSNCDFVPQKRQASGVDVLGGQ